MRKTIIFIYLFMALGLAGCGQDSASSKDLSVDSLTINSDGSVVEVITDTFDKDYYSVEGLEEMIRQEIDGKNITLDSIVNFEDQGRVAVVMEYPDIDAYNDFTGSDAFYGGLNEAFLTGKIKEKVFREAKSDDFVVLDADFIEKYNDYKIFITKDNMNVYTYGEVLFVDDKAAYDRKTKQVSFEESKLNHIIIFK